MALEYKTDSVSRVKTVYEGSCEQAVECEINLPDYCPDILRVLRCEIIPCVVSSKITGDRACADGNALMRIVYCDEDDNICSAQQSMPFSKYVETGTDTDGALFAFAKPEYVNCRAVSRRKAEIRGTLKIFFKICKTEAEEFVSLADTDGIQTKGGSVDYSSATACECKQFPLNETAELPRDYLPAQRIINTCAVPILSEAKIIKGKLLLKGEISVGIIYCADKNRGECVKFDYSIPVNQVVDAAGVSEDGIADVRMEVPCCDISAREDSDGEPRFLDINLVVSAQIKAYEKKTADYITDAYSTDGELTADYKEIEFCNYLNKISDTLTCTQTFDFSSLGAKKILSAWLGSPEVKFSGDSEKIIGKIPASLIMTDSDDKPVFCERELDFEYTAKGDGRFADLPDAAVGGYAFTNVNNGKTELKVEIVISGSAFSKKKERVMINAELSEKKTENSGAGIVVYFPDENEKLWDIARKYGTTSQAIMKENGITGDKTETGKPLIVPCS